MNLSKEVLDKYVGRYQLPDGSTGEIKQENNQLFLYVPGNEKQPLFAASEREFYSNAQFMNINFKYDGNNKVTGAEVELFGGSLTVKKL